MWTTADVLFLKYSRANALLSKYQATTASDEPLISLRRQYSAHKTCPGDKQKCEIQSVFTSTPFLQTTSPHEESTVAPKSPTAVDST